MEEKADAKSRAVLKMFFQLSEKLRYKNVILSASEGSDYT